MIRSFLTVAAAAAIGTAAVAQPTPPPNDASHTPKQPAAAPAKAAPKPTAKAAPTKPHVVTGSKPRTEKAAVTASHGPMSAWRKAYIAKHGHEPDAPAKSSRVMHKYRRCA